MFEPVRAAHVSGTSVAMQSPAYAKPEPFGARCVDNVVLRRRKRPCDDAAGKPWRHELSYLPSARSASDAVTEHGIAVMSQPTQLFAQLVRDLRRPETRVVLVVAHQQDPQRPLPRHRALRDSVADQHLHGAVECEPAIVQAPSESAELGARRVVAQQRNGRVDVRGGV